MIDDALHSNDIYLIE
jgi:hypothetical protein